MVALQILGEGRPDILVAAESMNVSPIRSEFNASTDEIYLSVNML
jgi:hypothetical protein